MYNNKVKLLKWLINYISTQSTKYNIIILVTNNVIHIYLTRSCNKKKANLIGLRDFF